MANWTDTAGSHTVTDHNSPTISADVPSGFSGYSTVFDDSSSQYLSVPHHTDFNFGTGNYTLDAWIKLDDKTIWAGILQKFNYNQTTGAVYGYEIDYQYNTGTSNRARYLAGADFSNRVVVYKTFNASANTWYHIAAYKVGTIHYVAVDGSAVTQTKTSTNHNTSYDIYVGRLYWDLAATKDAYFSGKIFLPRITNTNLWSSTSFTVPTSSDYNETGQKLLIEATEDVYKKIYPVNNPLSGNLTNLGVF